MSRLDETNTILRITALGIFITASSTLLHFDIIWPAIISGILATGFFLELFRK